MKNSPGAFEQKEELLEALGIAGKHLVLVRQVHSARVVTLGDGLSETNGASVLGPADGLISEKTDRFPVIRTADCLPVLGVLPEKRAVCVLHAGWRGTLKRVTEKGVHRLLELTGAEATELTVAIGPGIRKCCYQVGPEVREQFEADGHEIDRLFSREHLDLVEANRVQLEQLGVTRILDAEMCTACRTDLFYSYRREGQTGRLWALAGFRHEN